jgi:hypothetical protein
VKNCETDSLVREPTLTEGTVRLRRWTMAALLPRPQEGVAGMRAVSHPGQVLDQGRHRLRGTIRT